MPSPHALWECWEHQEDLIGKDEFSNVMVLSEILLFLTCTKYIFLVPLLTELVLGDEWVRDTWWATAIFVLSCYSEDVFLPFDEFGDRETGALQGRGDSDPANLIVLVVFLLKNVVQDLTTPIILRRLPVTGD